MLRRTAAAALVLAGIAAPAYAADFYCVDSQDDACVDTLAEALADPERTRIELREPQTGTFTDGGVAVEIFGSSIAADTTAPALTLTAPGSTVHDTEVQGLDLAGRAEAVTATARVTLQQGSALVRSTAAQGVQVAGAATLDDLDISGGLEIDAGALGRHLTIAGGLQVDAGALELRSSAVDGPIAVTAGATVTSFWSAHEESADVAATERVEPGGSLVDAGDPDPLTAGEPFHDLAGDTRVTDGDGDGLVRRDIGALETQPPPVPLPEGNVLANPGAEAELTGWGGNFVAAKYGDPFLPNLRQAAALGGGGTFFSAGEAETADLFQRIDLSASGRAVDLGGATAAFSALLGGYGADADAVAAAAVFKDPEGVELGRIALAGVEPAQRGNATNLLHRAASAAIPPRTRAIDVLVRAERVAADPPVPESYTDAYADNLALVLSVPGVPVDPPVDPTDPPNDNLKPFAGISVLTGQPSVGRGGAAKVRLACASDTVLACSGTIEIHAKLPRAAKRTRISKRTLFALAPGEARNARVKLLVAARKRLGRRRYLSARLIAIARDGQGVQREKTVPVRLKLPRRR